MTNQERKDLAAAGGQPGGDCEPGGVAGADDPCASFDYIDEAIEESMVASDPPALTPQTTIGPPGHAAPDAGRRD